MLGPVFQFLTMLMKTARTSDGLMNNSFSVYKTVTAFLIIPFIVLWGGGGTFSEASQPEFYYFNPDSSQSNLGRLKHEMDSFFSQAGCSFSFQPFAHQVDLDRKLKEKLPAFLFAPDWYLQKYGAKFKLKGFLRPVRSGKTSYRKVLMIAKASDITPDDLEDNSLAMTSLGPGWADILNKIMFSAKGVNAGELDTVIVPKDSDALIAVALGQVEMALVVKENLTRINNPRIMNAVRPLIESAPIPMPVISYSKGAASPSDIQKLKEVFLDAGKKQMRAKIMEMLQIDEWQSISK